MTKPTKNGSEAWRDDKGTQTGKVTNVPAKTSKVKPPHGPTPSKKSK